MLKLIKSDFILRTPTILDENKVVNFRNEFLIKHCKFNGTCNLDQFNDYLEWLAYTISMANGCKCDTDGKCAIKTYTYLAINKTDDALLGMCEITHYCNSSSQHAHVIECLRPSERRKGYGDILTQLSIEECRSFGIKKDKVTIERNSKS